MVRVVIVEDSKLLRQGLVLTTDWASLGCIVVGEAGNGLEGLALIEKLQPDLVITDIKMPGLDGLSMIERLKEKTKALFVIISAYDEFEYARKALQEGVLDYILKPIDDKLLTETITSVVAKIKTKKSQELENNSLEGMKDSRIMLFHEYFPENDSIQNRYVDRVISYINKNYKNDISLESIAGMLGISESRLSHVFKLDTGYSVLEYLCYYRIQCACRMLKDPSNKVFEVAYKTGFHDQRYFSTTFKKLVGLTPSKFQNNSEPGDWKKPPSNWQL
ncbi:MAG: response regulator [Sphaerochaetaceae bacterium]